MGDLAHELTAAIEGLLGSASKLFVVAFECTEIPSRREFARIGWTGGCSAQLDFCWAKREAGDPTISVIDSEHPAQSFPSAADAVRYIQHLTELALDEEVDDADAASAIKPAAYAEITKRLHAVEGAIVVKHGENGDDDAGNLPKPGDLQHFKGWEDWPALARQITVALHKAGVHPATAAVRSYARGLTQVYARALTEAFAVETVEIADIHDNEVAKIERPVDGTEYCVSRPSGYTEYFESLDDAAEAVIKLTNTPF